MEDYIRGLGECFLNVTEEFYVYNNVNRGAECEKVLPDCEEEEDIECRLEAVNREIEGSRDELESDHSIQILPRSLCLRKSSDNESEYSVWSDTEIPKGIRFGPYEGIILYSDIETHQNNYCQKIMENEYINYLVDDKHKSRINWLNYVNFALHQEQQNLIILKCNGQVYYETIRGVPPDTELLVWYEDDWRKGDDSDFISDNCSFIEDENKKHQMNNDSFLTANIRESDILLTNDVYEENSSTIMEIISPEVDIQMCSNDVNCVHSKMFKNNCMVPDHFSVPTKEKPYVCNLCEKRFTRKYHLLIHQRMHTGEKPYSCNTCEEKFVTKGSLTQHLKKHIEREEVSYVCDLCEKSYSSKYALKKHQRLHTGEKPYICDLCDMRFARKDTLRQHQYRHTGEKPFNCNLCEKNFSRNYELIAHQRLHTGEKPYICDICGRRFAHKCNLNQHKYIHTGEKRYVCNMCGKRFFDSKRLKIHHYIHSGEKPYTCDICGKGFGENNDLKRHKIIHTGTKHFHCEVCGKSFLFKRQLMTHQQIHTGERPYMCNVCGKSFVYKHQLTGHQRIHTGERPYMCDLCGKRFIQCSTFKRHKQTHKNEKVYV